MSIKGLDLRLAEVGRIAIGEKAVMGRGGVRPQKLDHFILTSTEEDSDGRKVPLTDLMRTLPADPDGRIRRLGVYLLHDDPDRNFATSHALYGKSGCKCRGDGETAERVLKTGEVIEVPCRNTQPCEFAERRQCKPTGKLLVVLADAPMIGGVFAYRTTSWHTIRSILAAQHFLATLTGGRLRGIRFELVVRPRTVKYQDGDVARTARAWYVNLEHHGTPMALLEQTGKVAQIERTTRELVALPAPPGGRLEVEEAPEDERAFAAEFYPDAPDDFDADDEVGGETTPEVAEPEGRRVSLRRRGRGKTRAKATAGSEAEAGEDLRKRAYDAIMAAVDAGALPQELIDEHGIDDYGRWPQEASRAQLEAVIAALGGEA